jgi:uncharacterized protein (DUF924 family)
LAAGTNQNNARNDAGKCMPRYFASVTAIFWGGNNMNSEEVLKFWFEEIEPSQHWKKDQEFDQLVRDRFAKVHLAARRCELFGRRTSAEGRLAEIIVLDQFSRNMFRGQPDSFSSDPLALALAQEGISVGADQQLTDQHAAFLYMPFMHSESAMIHEVALEVFAKTNNVDFKLKHKAIIDRFGRYPHRNEILNRKSTEEEIEFMKGPNSTFSEVNVIRAFYRCSCQMVSDSLMLRSQSTDIYSPSSQT